MAITVIKEGVNPNHSYVCMCSNCGALFRYNWDDVKDKAISSWHEHYVICPTCEYENAFSVVPTKLMEFNCTTSKLFLSKTSALIPEGCTAYTLYQNGQGISAKEVATIIPAGTPTLIIGTCESIELVPGIITVTEGIPIRLEYLNGNYQGYYHIVGDDIVRITEESNEIYGIPSSVDHLFLDFINL